jgi:NAD(P)-dependent dehydrogenase (short-subunit alcohol dehydrogenase family)
VLALGSGKGLGPFATARLADVKLGFEEKVYAHFATAQAALPFINPTGSLTFISGLSAQAAAPATAGIGAANAAVAMLVPILAVELKPLRVNGVSPGVIDTPWWDAFPEEQKQAVFKDYAAKTPVGRVGRPEDVAKAIAFLIGNDFMTGHMLTCDGGLCGVSHPAGRHERRPA